MRFLIPVLLLLSLSAAAQNPPVRVKTDIRGAYELAIREYIKAHPEAVYQEKGSQAKLVFVKKQPFTDNLKDTLDGVQVKIIDPVADIAVIAQYVHKKTSLPVLNLNQMSLREASGHVWVMPMKADWNPKKKQLGELKYEDKGCEYLFDYGIGGNSEFLFKESGCRDL